MLARLVRLTLHHAVNVESGLDQKTIRRLYTAAGSAVNRHGHRAFIAAGRRHPTHRRGGLVAAAPIQNSARVAPNVELTANTPSSCGERHRCIWTIT